MLTLLLIGMLFSPINVKTARSTWTGTVYIRADGSIEPSDAPIVTYDNIIYTLTGNITSSEKGIVVERDNIVIDGAGYTVQGTGEDPDKGVDLSRRSNVTIKNIIIIMFKAGIWLSGASNCNISGSIITNNVDGIVLGPSSNNTISDNTITANERYGIFLCFFSNYNSISENNITNNGVGIVLFSALNNTIYHNNFVNNIQQVDSHDSTNFWDDGYPSGGNYWSDYNGTDLFSGSYQNETGSDSIGDMPYVIDEYNRDNYPLMHPFNTFDAGVTANHMLYYCVMIAIVMAILLGVVGYIAFQRRKKQHEE